MAVELEKGFITNDSGTAIPRVLKPLTPDDPEHPQNWSTKMVAKEMGISVEVSILSTTLFLVGYVFGFLSIAPLSERFGRKYPMLIGLALASMFSLMPALAHNTATIFLGRFFSGLFGVSPVAILGGVIVDCWSPQYRGVAMACTISLTFSGPTFGAIIGGFIVNSHLGWRWTAWVMIIAGLGSAALGLVLFPETYPPVLLRRKAKRLSNQLKTKIITSADMKQLAPRDIVFLYLARLVSTQPILLMFTIYQSFVYGLLFLFYQSFPIAFGEDRNWHGGLASLPLLGVIVGSFLGTGLVFIYNSIYFKSHAYTHTGEFNPESRLPLMIIGGALIPAGMFWFAWTSSPTIPWPSQVVAGGFIGCGMYLLFIQCFTYIMDCYSHVANSAMGVNGAIRSIFGAAFPLFAMPMFHRLGVDWAMTVLGFVSLALVPVPVAFFIYGARIRARGSIEMPSK
ncbi:hypothetical protein DTO002I6_9852 [Penicillium roqueforti]|nr:hypothetical protein DTO002I6_9852 [Penicillium roqueforti]